MRTCDSLCVQTSGVLLSPRSVAIFIRPWDVLGLQRGQKLRQMVDFEVATGAIFTGGVSRCCPTVQERGQALDGVYAIITSDKFLLI